MRIDYKKNKHHILSLDILLSSKLQVLTAAKSMFILRRNRVRFMQKSICIV